MDTVPDGIQAARAQMESQSCLLSLSLLSSPLSGNCIHCLLHPVRAERIHVVLRCPDPGMGLLRNGCQRQFVLPLPLLAAPSIECQAFPWKDIQKETCPSKARACLCPLLQAMESSPMSSSSPAGSHLAGTDQGSFQVIPGKLHTVLVSSDLNQRSWSGSTQLPAPVLIWLNYGQ